MRLKPHESETCSLCGNQRAAAEWSGVGQTIYVCHECALEQLPKLIADAVRLPSVNSTDHAKRYLEIVKASFYVGLYSRLDREMRANAERIRNAAVAFTDGSNPFEG